MLSKEYTEWHLTPSGWVEGNCKLDFVGLKKAPTPEDTVLSKKYKESMASAYSPLVKEITEIWTNGNEEEITELEKKFPFPNHL